MYVRPSVRLSNAWFVTKKCCVQIFIPYERSISLVFWEEEWLVGATPFTWNFVLTGPRCSVIVYFQSIFARSASAVASSKKCSINANRKSTTRFPMSLRWTFYVAPNPYPRGGGSKTQNGRFPNKIAALCLEKVCYKVSFCENCQRQSYWRIYQCENDWWRTSPSTWKFGGYRSTPCKTPIFNLFSANELKNSGFNFWRSRNERQLWKKIL